MGGGGGCVEKRMSQTWFLLDFLLVLGKVHVLLVSTSSLLKDSRTLLYIDSKPWRDYCVKFRFEEQLKTVITIIT